MFFLLIKVLLIVFVALVAYKRFLGGEMLRREAFFTFLALFSGLVFFGYEFLKIKGDVNKNFESGDIVTVEGELNNLKKIGREKMLSFDVKETSFAVKSIRPIDGFHDWSDRYLRDGLYVRIKYIPYYNKEDGVRNKIVQIDVRQ